MPQIIYNEWLESRSTVNTLVSISGIVCILGFCLDMIAIAWNPDLSALEWRMGLMQQLGDRCLLLLFGAALLCYRFQSANTLRILSAGISILVGFGILFGGSLYFYDSVKFQSAAIQNLTAQQQSLEDKIQAFVPSVDVITEQEIDKPQKEKAVGLLREQTTKLENRAKIRLRKTVMRTLKSLLLSGLGLILIGKLSLKFPSKFVSVPSPTRF